MKTLAVLALVGTARVTSCDPVGTVDGPGSRSYDAQAYSLTAQFDWAHKRLHASEVVSVTAAPGQELIQLDAAVDVERVHVGEIDIAYVVDREHHTLTVDLRPLAQHGAPLVFQVDYQAAVSDALIASAQRDNDPVTTRVVFTDSEPDRGLGWLIAKHDPSDRAQFSVNIIVDGNEDVIANGHRTLDLNLGPRRLVTYHMDEPLPTYLMAFAAGELVHSDSESDSGVPLSVWHRRGLSVDTEAHLDILARTMSTFERLLGPYPFERYSVVMLPGMPTGMENATITFNYETSGAGVIDVGTNTHELAHHWFGDWVTMRRYEDVWFKEGMATLLAAEAQRQDRDREGKGRLFGSEFNFWRDDAIVDPTLHGLGKYTSGPYQRAAYLITQIRARVGEEVFWASLRDFLDANALGSADGETFVRSFAPALDEATIQQILNGLDKSDVPTINIAPALDPGNDPSVVTLSVDDPLGKLIAPIGITVVDADGVATTSALTAATPLTVTVPEGGYIAPDEADVHPFWTSAFLLNGDYRNLLVTRFTPQAPAAMAQFESRSAAHQERALRLRPPYFIGPTDLTAIYDQLDSPNAQRYLAFNGCYLLRFVTDPAKQAEWTAALTPMLTHPAAPDMAVYFGFCPIPLTTQLLLPELKSLVASGDAALAARIEYLLSFDYGPEATLAALAPLATGGATGKLRNMAVQRLSYQLLNFYFTRPTAEQKPAWRDFFRARLHDTTTGDRFVPVWGAINALADAESVPLAAPLLHAEGLWPYYQQNIVCQAFALTQADASLWTAFQNAAQPWATLDPMAQAALADPSLCSQP